MKGWLIYKGHQDAIIFSSAMADVIEGDELRHTYWVTQLVTSNVDKYPCLS